MVDSQPRDVEPSADLPERLQSLIDDGHADEAIVLFQREAVGLPDTVIEQIRFSPMFAALVPLAQSTVYDALLIRAVSTPTAAMIDVQVPVTICAVTRRSRCLSRRPTGWPS